ncbi:C40 family peptidase [Aquimarina sp. 2201CG5-10]|uniref:C40 family peptidase n=1 Tax=Aquimarina callyspongiae TaxID=3098150 RepID=UPI002AB48201|nr:C40 family peptidase [Aquimarina sp. 2201CG5-10]MDY8136823.1 C40 family peptidase [Aquimarina sp. 2201CG5-10]
MKKSAFLLLLVTMILSSCGSSKKKNAVVISKNSKRVSKPVEKTPKKIKRIINYAMTFDGTKYKYGGTTRKGMDCSGLIYTSFKKEEVILPRTSRAMSTQGKSISLKKVAVGDLLFFKTNKNKNVINHVGLVVATRGEVKFIHASVSKGVTVSSLNERYWNNCFVGIKRVL